jgi:hypothetical protein
VTTAESEMNDAALEALLADLFAAIEVNPRLRYQVGGIRNYPAAEPLLAADPAAARRIALCAARVFDGESGVSPPEGTPERARHDARYWGSRDLLEQLARRSLPMSEADVVWLVSIAAGQGSRQSLMPFVLASAERCAKHTPLSPTTIAALTCGCEGTWVDKKLVARVAKLRDACAPGVSVPTPPPRHAPAPLAPPNVLTEAKRRAGILRADVDGATNPEGADRFPLRLDSPLAAEHCALSAVVERLGAFGRERWKMPLEDALGPDLVAASPEARARTLVAALERQLRPPHQDGVPSLSFEHFCRMAGTELVDWIARLSVELDREAAGHVVLAASLDVRIANSIVDAAVDRLAASGPLTDAERHVLDRLRVASVQVPPLGSAPRLVARISDVLGEPAGYALVPGEAWSDALHAELAALPGEERARLLALLEHAAKATSAKPSPAWKKTATKLVDAFGRDALRSHAVAAFNRLNIPGTFARWQPGREHGFADDNMTVLRGIVWMLAAEPWPELTGLLAGVALACVKKVPIIGSRAVKVTNACVATLGDFAASEDSALRASALAQLARLRARVTHRQVQATLDKALTAVADAAGTTMAELEELGVPTLGFEAGGVRTEAFGAARVTLRVERTRVVTEWTNEHGKSMRSQPAAVARDFADDLKDLKRDLKDAEAVLAATPVRLDALYLRNASWSVADWRERYLDHGLVGAVARRLIWRAGDKSFLALDGVLQDVGGTPVALASDARVRLWHPLEASDGEALAWRERIEALGVVQPFKQAHREVYRLTDAERASGSHSNRFAAHIVKQHQCHALMGVRGWRSALRLSVDDAYTPPSRDLAEHGLRAELWNSVADTELTDSSAFVHLVTGPVRFQRLAAPRFRAHASGGDYVVTVATPEAEALAAPVPLTEIPPLVLSEVLRDIDLFVGVASVGNDPTWTEAARPRALVEYWRGYSFGELGATAATRRELLERLVPRLAIAARCTLEARFLAVRGELRTYRIHLGSGNVLMTPNDQYLCIVSKSAAGDEVDGVTLPFEGDRTLSIILSKAFLLANDSQITDGSILSQIRRS